MNLEQELMKRKAVTDANPWLRRSRLPLLLGMGTVAGAVAWATLVAALVRVSVAIMGAVPDNDFLLAGVVLAVLLGGGGGGVLGAFLVTAWRTETITEEVYR